MQDTRTWLVVVFNSNSILKGKEQFVEELRKNFTVQEKKQWFPACCDYTEFFVLLFENGPIRDFFLTNIAWELLKKGVKELYKALETLSKSNEARFLISMQQ